MTQHARDTHLLSGGTLLADWSGARIVADGAVAWRDGILLGAGSCAELEARHPQARRHDAHGGWIAPGLINAHHHIYSALATGLDSGLPIDGFGQALDRLWWRLDRALDEESIRVSVRLAALRCALAGCTTLVDHHASPGLIPGVLDMLAEELEAAGLSAVLCYEASDRNGRAGAKTGLEESARFRDAVVRHPRFRGLIGLHAAFTLSEESLSQASVLCREGDIHIHVAESRLDGDECWRAFGRGPLERLEVQGLLGPSSWIAHGVQLEARDFALLAERASLLVHCPESNANNRVGRLDLAAARAAGLAVGLGTDGMSACLLTSLRCAFLLHRASVAETNGDPDCGWRDTVGLLEGARGHVARLFDQPGYGRLEPGAPADLVVLEDAFPGELSTENLTARLVFGQAPPRVRHTVARGVFLVRDFEPQLLDAERLAREGDRVRQALWGRFAKLAGGTPYLGTARTAERQEAE